MDKTRLEQIARDKKALDYLHRVARRQVEIKEQKRERRRLILAYILMGFIGLFAALCLYLITY